MMYNIYDSIPSTEDIGNMADTWCSSVDQAELLYNGFNSAWSGDYQKAAAELASGFGLGDHAECAAKAFDIA